MDSFLDINKDWFSEKYLPLLGRRFWTFKIALNLFKQLGGNHILETGCVRVVDDWAAGMSTQIFSEYASKEGAIFDSVEISPENIETSKKVTAPYSKFVVYHLGDSLKVLKEWAHPIDLLFLDSLDTDPNDEKVAQISQAHQLKELELAYPNLTRNSLVLLDDNYFQNGGKTRLAKEFLQKNAWVNIMDYEASLWIRAERKK